MVNWEQVINEMELPALTRQPVKYTYEIVSLKVKVDGQWVTLHGPDGEPKRGIHLSWPVDHIDNDIL